MSRSPSEQGSCCSRTQQTMQKIALVNEKTNSTNVQLMSITLLDLLLSQGMKPIGLFCFIAHGVVLS